MSDPYRERIWLRIEDNGDGTCTYTESGGLVVVIPKPLDAITICTVVVDDVDRQRVEAETLHIPPGL